MKTTRSALVCGVTLLAVTGFANAQGTGITANRDQGVTPKQCWDVSSNIIREKNPAAAGAPLSEKAPQTTVGSTTAGVTGASAGASGSPRSDSNANASARPAGMPDC
jgi:hypothetical protein